MGWKDVENAKSSKDYLKIKDGEFIDIVIMGEPYTYYGKYQDKTEYKTKVPDSSFKFKLQVVVKQDGAYVGKILNGGFFLISDIKENIDENGVDSIYRIKRKGTGTDSRYFVIFKTKVPEEQMKSLKDVPLPALTSNGKMQPGDDGQAEFEGDGFAGDIPDEDIPF